MSIKYITKEITCVNSLIFPDEYRDITDEIDRKKSKVKNIKKIYMKTDVGDNPKQLTDITYKSPHCVNPFWEGTIRECWGTATNHPYGEVLIILKKSKKSKSKSKKINWDELETEEATKELFGN